MCAVAVVAHELIDGLSWAAAFTLGAIVAPTDPIAATAIARRQGAPRRIVSILEGESLVNDGTALVAYRVAVAAAVGGSFSIVDAGLEFVLGAAGGIARRARRRLARAPRSAAASTTSPSRSRSRCSAATRPTCPAEALHVSGVLAAVTTGVFVGWQAPRISTASMRLQGYAVWETLVFLLNALLFVLIGLQLPLILDALLGQAAAPTLVGQAIAISLRSS